MKISIKSLAALMMTAVIFTACTSEDFESATTPEPSTGSREITITINPPTNSDITRVGLTDNKITGWEEGDEVTLYKVGLTKDPYCKGVKLTCTSASEGIFTGMVPDEIALEDLTFAVYNGKNAYYVNNPVPTDPTVEYFSFEPKNMYSTNMKDVIVMSAKGSVSDGFNMQITGSILHLVNNSGYTFDAAMKARIYNPFDSYYTYPLVIPSVLYYNKKFVSEHVVNGDFEGKKIVVQQGDNYIYLPINKEYSSTSYTYPTCQYGISQLDDEETVASVVGLKEIGENAKLYTKTIDTSFKPTQYILPGSFTVSADKKVQFTTGNLYWDGSNFRLESSQNAYTSPITSDHNGYFYWTTTAEASYASSAPETAVSSTDKFFADGSDDDHMVTIKTANNKSISNLYVLKDEEWRYLLWDRSSANILCKCGVKVGDVENCLVIAPDDYNWMDNGSIRQQYTLDELNKLGFLCLPPAGAKDTSEMSLVGTEGRYRASDTHQEEEGKVYGLEFDKSYTAVYTKFAPTLGFSIRLVRTVK